MKNKKIGIGVYYKMFTWSAYLVAKHFNIPTDDQVRWSKKEGKDQESIQSSTTPDPGYQLSHIYVEMST